MRISELEGAWLDYWVARAAELPKPRVDDGLCWVEEPPCDGDPESAVDAAFAPSTDWNEGGPIIDREGISIVKLDDCWGAEKGAGNRIETARMNIGHTGATALIAAMRCYVGVRFGDEVPDEEMSDG
ncbi:phage protein NinX family protein [Trinickia mobilis]|uniref:phage protein NinX family protein n=1 Tax=Trinickia mobilis TaxID=2816356 RepID=UPI001A8C2D9D|nr:phage protein NinX family protein [Trinickia mobilis]